MLVDHDQLFKEMIREFFGDFLQLFFVDWVAIFDLDSVVWLEKELSPDPPAGQRHLLDLVAKVRTKVPVEFNGQVTEEFVTLLFIEIESADKTTLLKPRLPGYYYSLRQRHGLPVLPIVLYLKVGLNGIGEDFVTEQWGPHEILRFRYFYVGLPALPAEPYLQGDNPLGVALSALMKIPKDQIVQYGAAALEYLGGATLTEQKRFLLAECVEAYLPLRDEDWQQFEEALNKNRVTRKLQMNPTRFSRAVEASYKKGISEGMNDGLSQGLSQGQSLGIRRGQLEFLEAAIEAKFGEITPERLQKLRELPDDVLRGLARKVAIATEWSELAILD